MYYSASTDYWYVTHTDGVERPYFSFEQAFHAFLFRRNYQMES